MAQNIYQKAAVLMTVNNKGKKRIPIGQARESVKILVREQTEAFKRGDEEQGLLHQLTHQAYAKACTPAMRKKLRKKK